MQILGVCLLIGYAWLLIKGIRTGTISEIWRCIGDPRANGFGVMVFVFFTFCFSIIIPFGIAGMILGWIK